MKRISLFIVTNLAVLVLLALVIFVIQRVFGVRLGQGGAGGLQLLKRSRGEPLPPQMQAFGINTGESRRFMRLFMSHPPLDARIAALRTSKL
jgi:heat shock protein HtpX